MPNDFPWWAQILSVVVPIFVFATFIIVIALMISPKLRAKFIKHQLKTYKHVVDDSKDELTHIGTGMGNISVETKKRILEQNEETLQDMATQQANINREGIEIMAGAVKKGFTSTVYCKHCGTSIAEDSRYCRYCGKNQ